MQSVESIDHGVSILDPSLSRLLSEALGAGRSVQGSSVKVRERFFQPGKDDAGDAQEAVRFVNGKLKVHQFGRNGSRKVHHLAAGRFNPDLCF